MESRIFQDYMGEWVEKEIRNNSNEINNEEESDFHDPDYSSIPDQIEHSELQSSFNKNNNRLTMEKCLLDLQWYEKEIADCSFDFISNKIGEFNNNIAIDQILQNVENSFQETSSIISVNGDKNDEASKLLELLKNEMISQDKLQQKKMESLVNYENLLSKDERLESKVDEQLLHDDYKEWSNYQATEMQLAEKNLLEFMNKKNEIIENLKKQLEINVEYNMKYKETFAIKIQRFFRKFKSRRRINNTLLKQHSDMKDSGMKIDNKDREGKLDSNYDVVDHRFESNKYNDLNNIEANDNFHVKDEGTSSMSHVSCDDNEINEKLNESSIRIEAQTRNCDEFSSISGIKNSLYGEADDKSDCVGYENKSNIKPSEDIVHSVEKTDNNIMPIPSILALQTHFNCLSMHDNYLMKTDDGDKYLISRKNLEEMILNMKEKWRESCIVWKSSINKTNWTSKGFKCPTFVKQFEAIPDTCILNSVKCFDQVAYLELSLVSENMSLRSISSCTNLACLSITNSELKFVEGINSCQRLQFIDLSDNNIEFLDFNTMNNILFLDLHGNNITNIHNISDCARLKYLDLSNNRITKLSNVEGLKDLQYLNMSNNQMTSFIGLSQLNTLQFIDFSRNFLSKYNGDTKELGLLSIVDIMDNYLSKIPVDENNILLTHLNVDDNDLQELKVNYWYPHLKSISSKRNSISWMGSLKYCYQLESLDLTRNQLTDVTMVINSLKDNHNLMNFSISNNPCCFDESYRKLILDWMPSLETFNCEHVEGVKMNEHLKSNHGSEFEELFKNFYEGITLMINFIKDTHISLFEKSQKFLKLSRECRSSGIKLRRFYENRTLNMVNDNEAMKDYDIKGKNCDITNDSIKDNKSIDTNLDLRPNANCIEIAQNYENDVDISSTKNNCHKKDIDEYKSDLRSKCQEKRRQSIADRIKNRLPIRYDIFQQVENNLVNTNEYIHEPTLNTQFESCRDYQEQGKNIRSDLNKTQKHARIPLIRQRNEDDFKKAWFAENEIATLPYLTTNVELPMNEVSKIHLDFKSVSGDKFSTEKESMLKDWGFKCESTKDLFIKRMKRIKKGEKSDDQKKNSGRRASSANSSRSEHISIVKTHRMETLSSRSRFPIVESYSVLNSSTSRESIGNGNLIAANHKLPNILSSTSDVIEPGIGWGSGKRRKKR